MINTADEVLEYVDSYPDYKATIGIIKTKRVNKSFLSWAAVHKESGRLHVPFLSAIIKLHPEAQWFPLTPRELQNFLKNNDQEAFLFSQAETA